MTPKRPTIPVKIGFEEVSVRLPIEAIFPLREVTAAVRNSIKYGQIAASIAEVGIIEPPVVTRDRQDRTRFHLLDGHLRIAIMRERGENDVICLVALDDEAFTYNKRVSRIATIQEHRMILNAVKKGVSEERLARALNVNIANIRIKRNLLVGICPEAAALLGDKHVPIHVFTELRFLKPLRQIEAVQAMIAMNRYSVSYAKSLVAATQEGDLVEGRPRRPRGLTEDEIAVMQRESENIDREFKLVAENYGADHLDLVLAVGYVNRLLGNARVVRHLAHRHADILSEFQKLTELQEAA
ncbi:ParB N-terminal domain-containing protein [Sphingomonas sp. SUN019]|uniref:plasmid partitioning protein RepB C-terminal domain-containing protein n=1 Tax=Sphingomonas sp. SUN019 TaxID=2937788 RepID=UPI0021649A0B|nr:plasmid partitioning protein RepB C-terminal domain-containing protein [Sphingomonas sp. SUN019]UVO49662.1 ParB N-terminal domain-containing protein [Sphingomonas sp. SUN019]